MSISADSLDIEPGNCVFCAMVRGDVVASVVHEDTEVLAFVDLMPVTPGHLLVIPKLHVPYLSWVEEILASKVFLVAQRMAAVLQRADIGDVLGVNLYAAEGASAGQEVGHMHVHVIPRYRDDGFGLRRSDIRVADRAELNQVAARIVAAEHRDDDLIVE